MSTAIRDVSDTLIQLLRTEVGPLLPDPDLIALLSPAEANSIGVRLTLFLYSISPAAECRNEHEIIGASNHNDPISMPVNLFYLLTAFSPPQDPTNRSLDSHLLLGRAMRVFFDNGTLHGSMLKGDLPRDEPLHVSLQPITVEDLTRVWSVFPETALQASVSYLVTPVRLRAGRIREGAPVVSRQTDADHVVPVPSPDKQP